MRSPTDDNPWIWAVLGILAGLLIAVIIAVLRNQMKQNWQLRGVPEGTRETFQMLCDANNLTRHEVYLVRKMTADMALDNPLLPFVKPKLYDDYAAGQGARFAQQAKMLKTKLFS